MATVDNDSNQIMVAQAAPRPDQAQMLRSVGFYSVCLSVPVVWGFVAYKLLELVL